MTPGARVERRRDDGRTVMPVTHDMEEAERLCDRLVMIDQGQVVGLGALTVSYARRTLAPGRSAGYPQREASLCDESVATR